MYLVNYATNDDFACYVDDHGDCNNVFDLAEPRGVIYESQTKAIDHTLEMMEADAYECGDYVNLTAVADMDRTDSDMLVFQIMTQENELYGVLHLRKISVIQ